LNDLTPPLIEYPFFLFHVVAERIAFGNHQREFLSFIIILAVMEHPLFCTKERDCGGGNTLDSSPAF
jgi:hypothetical protein